MNNYIHVIDADGHRITSVVDSLLDPVGEEALLAKAKANYPDAAEYLYGGDDILDQFLAGKIYKGGQFIDIPMVEYQPTKAERIADIKKYYDKRFDALDKAVLRRRLANTDISDLQMQYKTLQAEMVTKIKAVK
jgi:hypothetical protein